MTPGVVLGVPWWRAFAVTGALAVTAVLALAGTDYAVAGRATSVVVSIASATALVLGPRRHGSTTLLPWRLIAGAVLAWCIAGAQLLPWGVWGWHLPRLAGAGLLVAALVVMARARAVRLTSWIEGLTVATSTALVVLEVAVRPFLAAEPSAVGILVAAPVALDLVAVGYLVAVLTTPGSWTAPGRLLLAGVATVVLTATVALVVMAVDLPPTILSALWLAAAVCWGAAALHPAATELTRPAPAVDTVFSRPRFVLVAVAALVAPGLVAADQLLPVQTDRLAVVVGAAILYSLLLARLAVAIRQIESANRLRDELQAQLAHDAAHDPLTQLPNRGRGLALVRRALATDRGAGSSTALLFIDLDGFKHVNDTLGHKAGDTVLRVVADRFRGAVRAEDTVIRFGGDEFLTLLSSATSAEAAHTVARRLVAEAARPIRLGDDTVRIGASIGVAVAVAGSGSASQLIHEADLAAYVAKSAGRGRAEVFDESMRHAHLDRSSVESELREALEGDELAVHFQPVVDTFTGAVRGFEALLRWNSPRRGTMLPGQFLPVAEQSELVCELDAWVLEAAARQAAGWADTFPDQQPWVAVNLAPGHVSRSRVVDDVQRAIARSGLSPRLLRVEVGERVLEDQVGAVPHLARLRRIGVEVTVDDYGSGFGSLARLGDLPVDSLKVHRDHLDLDTEQARRLLSLMVEGAHTIGLRAMAQGVELESQLSVLRSLKCDAVQGFHISEPLPAAAATRYLRERDLDRFANLVQGLGSSTGLR